MEKQLGWAHLLGGKESQGNPGWGRHQISGCLRHGTSLLALWLHWGRIQKMDNGLAASLYGSKLSPSFCLNARYFNSSLYVTGAFQAATLLLEHRGSECE